MGFFEHICERSVAQSPDATSLIVVTVISKNCMPSGNDAKLLRIFEKTTLQAKVNISFKPGAQKVNVSTFSESNERETLQMDFKITARCHVLKCI